MIFTIKSGISSTEFSSSSSVANEKESSYHQEQDHHEEQYSSKNCMGLRLKSSMIRLKIQSIGPICNSRRKKFNSSSRIFNEENEGGGDFAHQFVKEEWPNHNDDDDSCLWLSSGSSSPSCCFDDKIFGNLLELSLDDWLVSVLMLNENSSTPMFSRATCFFDGSRVNPLEESSFVLDRALSFDEEILREDSSLEQEITTWLMSPLREDGFLVTEVHDQFSESYEDCNVCKRNLELPEIKDFQEGILDSLVDLEDGENSEWISDTSKSLDLVSSTDYVEEAKSTELASIGTDEPIFWPFHKTFDWSSEFSWDFFIMSPRKNICKLLLQKSKMDFRERRNLSFNSTLASAKILEPKRASLKLKDDIRRPENHKSFVEETVVLDKHTLFLEEDLPGIEELSIEKLLGLNEFDGHEGIELEFNQDSFFMDESF